MYTFDPVAAVQEVNERDEKESSDMDDPPMICTPPPQLVAEQEEKVKEESVSFFEFNDNFAEIAPPFSDEHRVNVTPVIVCGLSTEVNANTPPFPDSLLMSVKVFVPLIVK